MTSLPDTSQRLPVTESPVTQADLDELRGPMRDSMMGEQFSHMDATRYDTEGRGLYTAQPALNPEPAPPPVEQLAFPEPPPPEPPAADYRQMYGQSENEKGQWRTLAQQQADALLLLQQQVAQLQMGGGGQPGWGYQSPPQAPPGPPPRLFPDRPAGELMTWGEMEQILTDEILPTMDLRARQAQDAATARVQRLMPQWDVAPQEEQQVVGLLRSRFPGLESRFTATEINSMIQDQVQIQRASRPMGPGGPIPPSATPVMRAVPQAGGAGGYQPAPPIYVDPNRLVRRTMHIETAPPAQMSAEPTSQLNPAQVVQAELNALERQKGARLSAVEYRALLIKHGVAVVNDFGTDVSTR